MAPTDGAQPVQPTGTTREPERTAPPVRIRVLLGGEIAAVAADPRALAALDESEQRRLARFRRPADADGFLAGRHLARTMLAAWSGAPAADFRFDLSPNGKPEVAAPILARSLRFSITHTDGLVACAVSAAGEIGLDAERHHPAFQFGPIVGRFFAAEEAAWLAGLPDGSRLVAFYDLWTAKEAVAKACGGDLAAALARPVMRQGPPLTDSAQILCQDEGGRQWRVMLSRPTIGHSLALAVDAQIGGGHPALEIVGAASLAD